MVLRNGNKTQASLEHELSELRGRMARLENRNMQLEGQVAVLRAAKEYMDVIFHSVSEGILVNDANGRIMKINRRLEEMVGYRESELVGKFTVEISTNIEEMIETQSEIIERLSLQENVKNFAGALQKKDGSSLPIFTDITFMKDASGNHLGAIAVVRERT